MNIFQFAISIVLLVCSVGMTLGALVTPSHMKVLSVSVFSIMTCICAGLVVVTYKELKSFISE